MTSRTSKRYAQATRFLRGLDADSERAIDAVGPCSHDPKAAREPYEALIRAIAYQQLTAKPGGCRLPGTLWRAPVDAFQQHRQLRRRQRHTAIPRHRPHEASLLETLGEKPEALAIPGESLDEAPLSPAEREQVPGEWILLQDLLRQHRQAIEALAHVGRSACQMDAHIGRHGDHDAAPSSTSGAMLSSALTLHPLLSRTSMMLERRRSLAAVATDCEVAAEASVTSVTGANAAAPPSFKVTPGMAPERTWLRQR